MTPQQDRWTNYQLPPLPDHLGVAAPFAGISGGSLLVAGGANFPNKMPWEGGKKAWTDAVWILDKINGCWREAGKLPRSLAYGVSVTHNDSLVCVGGSDAERHFAEAFRLTWKLGKLTIEQLPTLPMPLSAAGGALSGDTLYIACGAEKPGELAATNRTFAIDLAAKNPAWREIEPLPGAARILATAAVHDGAFYLFGGASLMPNAEGKIARVFLREAWSYRPAQGWKRCADLPKPNVAAPSPARVSPNYCRMQIPQRSCAALPGFRRSLTPLTN